MNTHKGLKVWGLLKKRLREGRGDGAQALLNNEIQRKKQKTYSDKVEEKLWGKRRSRSAIRSKQIKKSRGVTRRHDKTVKRLLPMSDRLRKWGKAKRWLKGRKEDLQGKYPVMDAKQTQKPRDEVIDKNKQQKREINELSCSHFSLSSSPSNELILFRGGQLQQHPSNQSRPIDAYNKESVCSFLGLAYLCLFWLHSGLLLLLLSGVWIDSFIANNYRNLFIRTTKLRTKLGTAYT